MYSNNDDDEDDDDDDGGGGGERGGDPPFHVKNHVMSLSSPWILAKARRLQLAFVNSVEAALARLTTHVVIFFSNRLKRIQVPVVVSCYVWGRFSWPLCCFGKQLLVKIRAFAWTHPELTTRVLKETALVQRTVDQTNSGLAAVLAFVCNSLGWTLNSEEPFYIATTPQGNGFCIKGGSKSFFVEELDHTIFLLDQGPERHDFFDDLDSIYVFLTRFLHDSSFATRDDMELFPSFLAGFPKRYSKT